MQLNRAAVSVLGVALCIIMLGLFTSSSRPDRTLHPAPSNPETAAAPARHPQDDTRNDGAKRSKRSGAAVTPSDEFMVQQTGRCGPGVDHLRTSHECDTAAHALGLADSETKPAVEIDSDILPHGCYYKAKTATYYANFMNHSSQFYHRTEQRLYFNPGGVDGEEPLAPAKQPFAPQHPHEAAAVGSVNGDRSTATATANGTRVGLCRVARVCPVGRQGRSCDDWLRAAPHLGYSCSSLEKFGLSCAHCRTCPEAAARDHDHAIAGCGDDPRLHCRFEKSRHKRLNQYSAAANAVGARTMLRVVAIGDTHGQHQRADPIPPGDVFIHTGDFTSGKTTEPAAVLAEIEQFNEWLGTLPHKHKYFVSGNHDADGGVGIAGLTALVTNAVHLLDSIEGVDVENDGYPEIKIWGSPWQPQFSGFESYVPEDKIAPKWRSIPGDGSRLIVVTHTPAFGDGDVGEAGAHVGSLSLQVALNQKEPLLHLFGHIHPGRVDSRVDETAQTARVAKEGATLHINVASQNGAGSHAPARRAVVIDVPVID